MQPIKLNDKKPKKYVKKILISLTLTIFILFITIIIFISPIAKYLVEKYDVKFLGRQITLNQAYVNPLTGFVYLKNLKVYEANSDSLFFSAHGVSANFELLKLFSKTYEISELVVDRPRGVIIQDTLNILNFNDIIKRFSAKDKPRKTKKTPLHFNLLNWKILDGEFIYRESKIPINYSIRKVNIQTNGLSWESDSLNFQFSFIAGIGKGDAKGNLKMNIKNLDYNLITIINKYDLKFIEQYLKDFINYGSFSANLDANVQASGNFKKAENLLAKGGLAINDFHFGKNKQEDYASFKKFAINIYELSPKNKKYIIDSVSLNMPYLKYERYDHLDNLQTIFGKKGQNVSSAKHSQKFNLIFEIADYVVKLSKNFLKSNYKINRLAIYKGNLLYNDFKLSEKVSLGIRPFYVIADSVSKKNSRVKLDLKSGLNPYGNIAVHISINPKDSSDFDLNFKLQKIPATLFNPYLVNYTSYPLDRGTIEITGNWHVRNGVIRSNNHLLIIDPRVGKKVKKKGAKWIPLPLIMAIVRERANVIDYEIPITGNLKKPKLHWHDVIFDVLENIFLNPPTTPYRYKVKQSEKTIEKILYVKWQMQQSEIYRGQEKFLNKVAKFLEENPSATISVYPQTYSEKEKEYILFYEAKKKYFLTTNKIKEKDYSEDDSLFVQKLPIKDSVFFRYITKFLNNSMLFTIQDKCERYVGAGLVNKRFSELLKSRKNAFLEVFKENETVIRVKMKPNENTIPYNGFSFFKIMFDGDMPIDLSEAYKDLEEYNDEKPRKKYFQIRKKIKNMFKKPK